MVGIRGPRAHVNMIPVNITIWIQGIGGCSIIKFTDEDEFTILVDLGMRRMSQFGNIDEDFGAYLEITKCGYGRRGLKYASSDIGGVVI